MLTYWCSETFKTLSNPVFKMAQLAVHQLPKIRHKCRCQTELQMYIYNMIINMIWMHRPHDSQVKNNLNSMRQWTIVFFLAILSNWCSVVKTNEIYREKLYITLLGRISEEGIDTFDQWENQSTHWPLHPSPHVVESSATHGREGEIAATTITKVVKSLPTSSIQARCSLLFTVAWCTLAAESESKFCQDPGPAITIIMIVGLSVVFERQSCALSREMSQRSIQRPNLVIA